MKYILLFIISLNIISYNCIFSQTLKDPNDWYRKINAENWENTIIDIDGFISNSDTNKISLLIIRQIPDSEYEGRVPKLINNCLNNFSNSNYNIRIWELNANNTQKCKIKIDNKVIENPDSRSSLYLVSKMCDTSSIFENTLQSLFLDKKLHSNSNTTYYQSFGVSGEPDFCWKLSQIKFELDKLIEQSKKPIEKKYSISDNISFGFQMESGNNISSEISDVNYVNSNNQNFSSNSFFISASTRINNNGKDNNRLSLGLTYSYSYNYSNSNLNNFKDNIRSSNVNNGIESVNVYGINIIENYFWNANKLGLELKFEKVIRYNLKHKNRFFNYGISFNPYLISRSKLQSSVQEGAVSYRGINSSVSGEFINIENLGLIENYSLKGSSSNYTSFSGYGYSLKANFSIGNDKLSFSLLPYYSTDNYINNSLSNNDNYILSNRIGTYNSLLNSTKSISFNKFGLGVSINFSLIEK